MPSLARLSVTPLKGTLVQHPRQARLTDHGIPGNRLFYLVDDAGVLFTGREYPRLVQIVARYDAATEVLTLSMPGGTEVAGAADQLGDRQTTDVWGRPLEAAAVLGPFSEALSDFCSRDVHVLRCLQDGDAVDDDPLTVVSFESVRDLGTRGGHEGALDARRFRMNLELEGCEPYDEETWAGRRVQVGEATIQIGEQVPRCAFTTTHPETGDKDWKTLHHIAKLRPRIPGGGLPFGVYATVVEPGTVRVGDRVTPVG